MNWPFCNFQLRELKQLKLGSFQSKELKQLRFGSYNRRNPAAPAHSDSHHCTDPQSSLSDVQTSSFQPVGNIDHFRNVWNLFIVFWHCFAFRGIVRLIIVLSQLISDLN